MQKLGTILLNDEDNKKNKNQYLLRKIWYNIIPEEAVEKTTPYYYNDKNREAKILFHDNMWRIELSYLKEDYIEKFAENGLIIDNLIFEYSIKHDKYAIKKEIKEYELTEKAVNYIENTVKKINNKILAEKTESLLKTFFKKHNYNEWIIK